MNTAKIILFVFYFVSFVSSVYMTGKEKDKKYLYNAIGNVIGAVLLWFAK